MVNDNDFSDMYNEDIDTYSDDYEIKPQPMDFDVFNLRTNPEQLLEEFYLQLLNKTKKLDKNGDYRDYRGNTYKLEKIPNTKSRANQQGVQEIMQIMRMVINNHSVQGNTDNSIDHKERMGRIADMLTRIFWTNRKKWDLGLNDVNTIVNSAINLIDLFLSRTIKNQERLLYGEQFKENTTREVKTSPNRPNPFLRMFQNNFRR